MGHAAIDNQTKFAIETLFLNDEEARPVLVIIARATYDIVNGRALALSEKQAPIAIAGALWGDDPETSSYRFETEIAIEKPSVDVVLNGHAWAPRGGVATMDVTLSLGTFGKVVRVFGDRVWSRVGVAAPTRPQAFEKIPLRYENAFGGKDRTMGDVEGLGHVELRNPVGMGYRAKGSAFAEGLPLPNLEDPANPITSYGQTPPPACFGFVSPGWQPRVGFGGTFDDAWTAERMPLYPKDFDRKFFNAASPGLVAPAPLRGDEPVAVHGASPRGAIGFRLPGQPPPTCRVAIWRKKDVDLEMKLDTIVIEPDEEKVYLGWRAHVVLKNGPHDVKSVGVGVPWVPRPENPDD